MEEFPHDPMDDLYPVEPFAPVPGVPNIEDLNANPLPPSHYDGARDDKAPIAEGVPIPPPGPLPEEWTAPPPEDPPPPRPVQPRRRARTTLEPVANTPAARHVEALMTLASFYDEHPEAFVPGGEHFTTAQTLTERLLNLGGEWEHELRHDEVVIRLCGLPDGIGPHLHCPCSALAQQWLEDIGVPEAE